MNRPLVSIIIPCFNAERTVGEAIQSALDQTYAPKEIIVVDDGSGDSSLQIIQSFGERIRWVTGCNRGGNAARNAGLRMARGEYIQFLDADDLLLPAKLETQVPLLLNGKADVVFCAWIWNDLAREKKKTMCRPCLGNDSLIYVLSGPLQTSSGVYEASLLRRLGGFDETLCCAQEYELHVRLALAGMRCDYVDRVLYEFHKSPDGVSGDTVRVTRQVVVILGRALEQLRADGSLTAERAAALQDALLRAGRHLTARGEHHGAFEAFRLAGQTGAPRSLSSRVEKVLTTALGLGPGLVLLESMRRLKRLCAKRCDARTKFMTS